MSGFYTKPECGSVQSVHDPETIHDIIAEILAQNQGLPEDAYALSPLVCDMLHLADRLVAAYKRELGNVQKMREALEYVLLCDATDEAAMEDGLTDAERIAEYADHIEECQKKAKAALSAPPRNCDVGTAKEQTERFMAFCKNYPRCSKCPCCKIVIYGHCDFVWGQMLYTKPEDASTGQEEGK